MASPRGQHLGFEPLEDRCLLATFMVTNTNDVDNNGVAILGSLRWAIGQANATAASDTIIFSDNIFAELGAQGFNQEQLESAVENDFGGAPIHSITLTGGTLDISQPVDILGPGYKRIIVDQNTSNTRVFNVNIGADDVAFAVEISGITIQGGSVPGDDDDDKGGGVFNTEALTMREVRIRNNSASMGGGGVYTKFGSLELWRAVVEDNSGGGDGGGGILNGSDGTRPSTRIVNSTIHNNNGGRYGGGVLNRNGTLSIESSTITGNAANDEETPGDGVASWGNPVPEEEGADPPPPTVFTRASNSIIFGNAVNDFDRVGMTDDEEPIPLLPSVTSRGYNIVGTGNTTEPGGEDEAFTEEGDQVGVDPMLLEFGNFGGSVDTYILDPMSPAIDAGDPEYFQTGFRGTNFDARGRHFTRIFNWANPHDPEDPGVVDIGATEMQAGVYVVDTLVDEYDYSAVELFHVEYIQGFPLIQTFDYGDFDAVFFPTPGEPPFGFRLGDLSLREALDYAARNPGKDTIQFSPVLNTLDALEQEDPDPSAAPTIILNRAITYTRPFGTTTSSPHRPAEGSLKVRRSELLAPPADDGYLDIEGPQGFILEIDGRGNDLNPISASGGGSRVFLVDDLDNTTEVEVTMSNVTLMGGDVFGDGGGILNRENLTLTGVTIKNNNATDDGGALFIADGIVNIDSSTFNNNRAGDNGGAIDVFSGLDLNIVNSTFSANLANNRGGAIYNENSVVLVEHSTLTLNSAGALKGSGIANINTNATAAVQTQVRSSIISKNVGNADVDFIATATNSATAASFDSLGYNFIGKGSAKASFNKPGDQIDQIEPLLEPLLNTGGLVETHRPVFNASTGQISPVIDAGHPSPPSPPTYDQRGYGYDRIKDGNLDMVARIDIGAYELQGVTLIVSNASDENDGVVSFGSLSLREAIALANLNPFPDVILFDPAMVSLLAQFQNDDPTIFLGDSVTTPGTPADLRITGSLTIDTEGQQLALDGELLDNPSGTINGSRMFTVDDGNAAALIDVTIRGLEFRNARAPQAGSVFWSRENLTIEDAKFINNQTRDEELTLTGLHGGAIYQEGVAGSLNNPLLKIVRSDFTSNSTQDVNADGGTVYVTDANLTVEDSSFAGNSTGMANSEGGAIAIRNGIFNLAFSSVSGNFTGGGSSDGGGFFAEGSTVILNGSSVSGNETFATNSDGAGFAAIDSAVTLTDSIVSTNTARGSQSRGGGIFSQHSGAAGAVSTLELNRSELRQNTAEGINAFGGGLALYGGSATFSASAVTSNRVIASGSHGAGLANVGGTLLVRGSTVASNVAEHAQSKGGGVYSDTNLAGTQLTTLLNSTVSGNSAGLRGGGVFNLDGRVDIKHSTITNNAVSTINSGSGVASTATAATTLTTVHSSIIAENVGAALGTRTDVDSVDGSTQNTFQSLGYNVIGTGNALAAFSPPNDKTGALNAGLEPLADNGAPAGVLFEMLTHALSPLSVAVNAGSPTFNPASYSPTLSGDQRGGPRVLGGRIDVGAVESSFATPVLADFDSDNDVDGADFLTWQRNLGRTGATKPQGDANGDTIVNGSDLAAWRSSFGAGSTGLAAAAVSSSGALPAEEPQEALATATFTAVADLSPLASLGTPGAVATSAKPRSALAHDAWFAEFPSPAVAPTYGPISGYSLLQDDDSGELSLLAATDDDATEAVEDAVFAGWWDGLQS